MFHELPKVVFQYSLGLMPETCFTSLGWGKWSPIDRIDEVARPSAYVYVETAQDHSLSNCLANITQERTVHGRSRDGEQLRQVADRVLACSMHPA